MKIVVLGGAGDMGSRAAEDLARSEGVTRVTIADRNVMAAWQVVARLAGQGAPIDVRTVDADNHQELVDAIRGYDVAASALGPFHLFEAKLVRAALEAGTPYASLCDEWEAARTVMDEYGPVAREKGIPIISGLGTSPGISNAGIRFFADHLDRLLRADVYVYQLLKAGGGEAVVKHMLHIISGQVVVWRAGRCSRVPACSEERVVEFPRFGQIRVWNMGHSEPETVPRFIRGIEEVNFLMGFGPGSDLFIRPARLRLLSSRRLRNLLARLIVVMERRSKGEHPDDGAVRIDVWGQSSGQAVHRMACGVGQMREATGLSLSIGALMLARRELLTSQGGVYAPEGVLPAKTFLARLAARGVTAYEDLAMTRPLVP